MNYLAHLYLAGPDPESLVGNLMGDFIKGPVPEDFPPGLRRGIVMHRRIDVFTDAHPVVARSKRRIRPRFRRYAGILVDIFFDHFLARDWRLYSEQPLQHFSRYVYSILESRYFQLPPRMQRSVVHMIANDLLLSYREISGIQRALTGIESRLKRQSDLGQAICDLETNYESLRMDFTAFFQELMVYARNLH